jgi:SAM-dependent methyltransferase
MQQAISLIKSTIKKLPLVSTILKKSHGPTRESYILRYITKDMQGLEVAPYFRPLAPKKQGYNCKTLDIFDQETLIQRALDDKDINDNDIKNIESVDFLGSASNLWELLSSSAGSNSLDYIVSSHNFEHLPNPIKFLQDCNKLLVSSGVLSMAVPDLRCCFDYYRWPTTLTNFLMAYLGNKQKPSPYDIFNGNFVQTNNFGSIGHPRDQIEIIYSLDDVYRQLMLSLSNSSLDYNDAHCQVFTPSSFQLLILELRHLKLIDLDIFDISETIGNEFFVHLKPTHGCYPEGEEFKAKRQNLLASTIVEISKKQ